MPPHWHYPCNAPAIILLTIESWTWSPLLQADDVLRDFTGEEAEEVMLIDDEDEFETDKCQAPRYLGHPSGAVDEVKGIRDKRLSLIEDGEEATNS